LVLERFQNFGFQLAVILFIINFTFLRQVVETHTHERLGTIAIVFYYGAVSVISRVANNNTNSKRDAYGVRTVL
jgi:hypothetical protein